MGTRSERALRLGTRGSKLALAQAASVRDLLSARDSNLEIEIVTIRTSGDRGDRDRRGAFVREIQEAVLDGSVDVALHCLKDLPTDPVPGLRLCAFLERADPRDALISPYGALSNLPNGATVGTGSLRRTSQLAARRPDLVFKALVGNVDTRLRKVLDGEYDAIVLAVAGLIRLGLTAEWESSPYATLRVLPLENDEMLPAPGQAVLVLETRADDPCVEDRIRALNDPATEGCATAERAFLAAFGGGCSVPVAALACGIGSDQGLSLKRESAFRLRGRVASPDGGTIVDGTAEGAMEEAEGIGRDLGERVGRDGGFEIVERTLAVRARQEVAR